VGSHEQLRFSGRVIAATNQSLDELRGRGLFREDLFYRLCSDVIVVPSLRQRLVEDPKELDTMVLHVIKRIVGEASKELFRMVREVINTDIDPHYAWPGNVRELEQAVRRILLTRHYQGNRKMVSRELKNVFFSGIEDGTLSAQQLVASYCVLLHDRFGTYEEVSRRTNLDRRTVKKHIEQLQNTQKDNEQ